MTSSPSKWYTPPSIRLPTRWHKLIYIGDELCSCFNNGPFNLGSKTICGEDQAFWSAGLVI